MRSAVSLSLKQKLFIHMSNIRIELFVWNSFIWNKNLIFLLSNCYEFIIFGTTNYKTIFVHKWMSPWKRILAKNTILLEFNWDFEFSTYFISFLRNFFDFIQTKLKCHSISIGLNISEFYNFVNLKFLKIF